MIISQLSVFIENKPGRLSAVLEVLTKNGIDISALSMADTAEFGILRMIVSDLEKARSVLMETGVVVRRAHVVAVAMEDVPGAADGVIRILAENKINIEYLYAFAGKVSGKALMVFRADDNAKADETLRSKGYGDVNPADIYRLSE